MTGESIPYDLLPDDEIEVVMEAFRLIFDNGINAVLTKIVRVGGASDIIYVPKKYQGKRATVIIWNDKEKIYSGDGVIKDAQGNIINEDNKGNP